MFQQKITLTIFSIDMEEIHSYDKSFIQYTKIHLKIIFL